jgi:DHA1 family tetracycline resistance protein-like MFS transporter
MAENDSGDTQSLWPSKDPCCNDYDEEIEPETTDPSSRTNTYTLHVEFFRVFFAAKGAPQVLLLSFLLSFGVGTTIGVVPDVLSDVYARIHHGYDHDHDGPHCSDFGRLQKPVACQQGADDAQAAVALFSFLQNMLTLVSNTTVGSVSDARGRRGVMILSVFLSILSPAVLVLMQLSNRIDPLWYFISFSLVGLVNFISIGFSMLSDVIPPHYRAPSFGLFVSSFYLGFCIGPSFCLFMNHLSVSLLSFALLLLGLLYACLFLPETLPEQVASYNLVERTTIVENGGDAFFRPFREMSILNRDVFFRLLTVAYFFSGMVYSSDKSLVLFYIEDQLNVRDGDLARMFLIMGLVGVVIQGLGLDLLLSCLGEKRLLLVSFASGTLHNLLYGLAKSKETIYVALCVSQLTKTNFPLVSSIASNLVSEKEQGRMQGALFALSALANAVGPLSLELIYKHTKDGQCFGPGTMWVFASMLYFVGTILVFFLSHKHKKTNSPNVVTSTIYENDLMEEPLLGREEA